MSAWDAGRAAARRGESKRSNPYDVLGSPYSQSKHERLACEWAEGYDSFNAEEDAEERKKRARKAAHARWAKTSV